MGESSRLTLVPMQINTLSRSWWMLLTGLFKSFWNTSLRLGVLTDALPIASAYCA